MIMKTNYTTWILAAAICAAPLPASAGSAPAETMTTPPSPSGWEFTISPYGWLTAIDGTNGPTANPAEVDASFSDIFDVLEMAAAIQFEARHGRWGVIGDVFYAELGTSGTTDGPAQAAIDVSFKQFLGELDVFYRVADTAQGHLDFYAGVRYNDLSLDLEASANDLEESRSADKEWADPIIGARMQWQLNERWYLTAKGDIGGFGVSSEFTWNLQGTVGYQFNDRVSAEVGYRAFDTDYEDDGFTYDITQAGLLLGVNVRL